MSKYRTVQLPDKLVKEVIEEVKNNSKLGYRSHSEFIIDATRRRLEKVRKQRTKE